MRRLRRAARLLLRPTLRTATLLLLALGWPTFSGGDALPRIDISFDPLHVLPDIQEKAGEVVDHLLVDAAISQKENRRFLRSHLNRLLKLRLIGLKKKMAASNMALRKALKKKPRKPKLKCGGRKIHKRGSRAAEADLPHDPGLGRLQVRPEHSPPEN